MQNRLIKLFLLFLIVSTITVSCKKEKVKGEVVKIPVKTMLVKKEKYSLKEPVYGIAKGDVFVLRALVNGKVEGVFYKEGDFVKKDSVIMKIGTSIATINLNNAKIKFNETERDFNRNKKMFDKGLISRSVFEKSKLMYDIDKNHLELAKEAYSNTFVKAPFSGYLEEFDHKNGEMLGAGSPLGKIAEAFANKVEGSLPLAFSGKFEGQFIKIKIRDKTYTGKIRYISKDFITGTKFKKIIIDIEKRDKVVPGVDVLLELNIGADKNGILLPLNVVQFTDKGKKVFTVSNGIARSNIVNVGSIVNEKIEILSGLKEGDKVVFTGQQYLSNGSEIVEK